MTRALVAALACASVVVAPLRPVSEARADERDRIRKRLADGKTQFDELEYAQAIRTLAPIPHDPAATRADRLRALELIGLSYLILGEEVRAREAFQDLLAIDPGYQLRDDTGSPKIREFFDRVKRAYVPGFDPSQAAELDYAAPPSASAGRRVEFAVRVREGGAMVKELVVAWRRRGVLDYSEAPARSLDDNRWRARFDLPAAQRAYAIDYYIEARDIAGRAIGRIGGPETPLSLRVSAGGLDDTPWYARWYVIAGGAVLVGISSALLITSGDSAPDGTLDPGTIPLTP